VVSFALEFLARVWQPLAWTQPFTLFADYRPQDVIRAGLSAADVLLLAAVSLGGVGTAAAIFQRRDL
jgi:hypothetical protein